MKETENLIFFGVRSIFISSNEHQKLYFHEWRVKACCRKEEEEFEVLVGCVDTAISRSSES